MGGTTGGTTGVVRGGTRGIFANDYCQHLPLAVMGYKRLVLRARDEAGDEGHVAWIHMYRSLLSDVIPVAPSIAMELAPRAMGEWI